MKKIILSLIMFSSLSFFVFADNIYGPDITLKTTVKSVDSGKQVKVSVNFSEPVLLFGRGQVSVDGASLESVRKLGPYSYLVFLRAGEDMKEINVQIESGKVQNYSKVFNEYASNELKIKIIQPKPITPVSNQNEISNLLDSVVRASQQSTTQIQQTQPVQQVQYVQPVQYTQTYVQPYTQPYVQPYSSNVYYQQPYTSQYNSYADYNQNYQPSTSYRTIFYEEIDDWFDW